MITPQQQQQIDAAMELLSAHIASPPWEEAMVQVFTDAIDYAAEMLEIGEEDVLDYLDEQPLGQMAHAHVFEYFVNTEFNEEGESVLQQFMRTRVEQSADSYACHYLKALSESELAIWEVIGLKPGQYAQVRRLGSDNAPVNVVTEATSVPQNMCLAARLLALPDGVNTFGYSLLPIERSEAEDILAYLQQVRAEMLEKANSGELENVNAADLEEAIHEEMVDLMFYETLTSWLAQGFED